MLQRVAKCDGPNCPEEKVIPDRAALTAIVDDVPEGWILIGIFVGGQSFERNKMMTGPGDPIFHSMACLGSWALGKIKEDEG